MKCKADLPLNSSILVIYYTGEKAAGQSESLGSVKKSQVEKWRKKRKRPFIQPLPAKYREKFHKTNQTGGKSKGLVDAFLTPEGG
ncbi:MAG: hypothetical protein V8S34_03390, partial [Lawsonibacter sp.]